MAATHDLIEFVTSNEPTGEFRPYAYYGAEEDALTFYFRGDRDYAKRLNSRVTKYVSIDTEELVGVQVKGVRSVLEDIGEFDMVVRHGRVKLHLLVLALRGNFGDDPDARDTYRSVGRATFETDVELEVPQLA